MSAVMAGFLGLCLVMTLTPGLDTAMVVRNALRRGPAAGVLTAFGCALGLFAHAAAVALGLAAILLRSAMVFEVVRWVGAGVLVMIGALSLRAAITGRGVAAPAVDAGSSRVSHRSSFAQGLLTNLTNPKATLFLSPSSTPDAERNSTPRGKVEPSGLNFHEEMLSGHRQVDCHEP